MAYTYTYTLAQFTALTQPQPSIAQLRRDIEAASLGQALLTVMPQQYASVAAETPTAPTHYKVEFAAQLSAPNATTLNGIIAAHTGVYTAPKTKIYASSGTSLEVNAVADGQYLRRVGSEIVGGTPAGGGGVTETSGPTDLTWGDIPDGSLLERNGTVLQKAINVARVRQYAATPIASVAAITAGAAETWVSIPVISGRKYSIDSQLMLLPSATTIGPNLVVGLSSATVSNLILSAIHMQTGSSSRAQYTTSTDAAPTPLLNSSGTASVAYPMVSNATFTCTGSGDVLLKIYKSGTGNIQVVSGNITVHEITWS